MSKKTRIDFQIAAFNKGYLGKWVIHECSICRYPCGYVFCPNKEFVAYDSGCHCTGRSSINDCSWDRLAEFYNMQEDQVHIKKMDDFWGFNK